MTDTNNDTTAAEAAETSTETTDNEDLSGLRAKRDELLASNHTLKERAEKAERALKTANNAKLTSEEQLKLRAETAEKALRDTRADYAISRALIDNAVDTAHVRAAKAILKLDMEFDDDGNPTIDGQNVEEFAKSFFANEGKNYTRLPNNDGGGASGSTTKAGGWTKMPETAEEFNKFDALPEAERNAICLRNGWDKLII